MNFNKAIICGRATDDPRGFTANGTGAPITNFSVATNHVYKNQAGNQTKTEFHNVVCFGKLAELAKQYITKGQFVLVEGRINKSSWTGQDGTKRERIEIIAENIQFGPRSLRSDADGSRAGSCAKSSGQGKFGSKAQTQEQFEAGLQEDLPVINQDEPVDDINPDDIPF